MGANRWLVMAAMAVGLVVGLAPADAEARKAKSRVELSGVLNLNQATASQLDLLPGVGEKAAEKIIAHRKKSPFKRIEELVRVKGFGKKKFARLKPHLTVTGPTTLTSRRVKADAGANAEARSSPPAQARRGGRR